MAPTFSIRCLLGVIAFIGVNIAGFLQPFSAWPYVAFVATGTLVVAAVVVAAGNTSSRAVFCRAFVVSILVYGTLIVWEPPSKVLAFPRNYFVGNQPPIQTLEPPVDYIRKASIRGNIAICSVQLLFGGIVGLLAVQLHGRFCAKQCNCPK